jgi:AcrR family transcriptional regulator
VTDSEEGGRYRQRRRTRAAIVDAAARLLKDGRTPSMAEVAEAADVSRRTLYQYFPTLDHLLLDATLGTLSGETVPRAIEAALAAGGDDAERVANAIGAIAAESARQMTAGRSLIRLTVGGPPPEKADAAGAGGAKRGFRRVAWLEQATAPLKDVLSPGHLEHLITALAMVAGWEALIVLSDIRGLTPGQQQEIVTWSARALIDAALQSEAAGERRAAKSGTDAAGEGPTP